MNGSGTAPVWQTHLDAAGSDESEYHNFANPRLLELFDHPPRVLLDVGCAAGQLGALVKQRHPGARVVGIELNRAAAASARQRIDFVLEGKFEDVDLAQAGIAPGALDTVVVADVLEHMYDPWRAMAALKRQLSPDAQVIASIPNTRNLGLMKNVFDGGTWRYEAGGLLDITHIRFFTLADIKAFFEQTGYRVEHVEYFLQAGLEQLYAQNKDKAQISVTIGRITLDQLTPQELAELCTWQFFVRARPA